MQKTFYSLAILLLVILASHSCKVDPVDLDYPIWEPELLGPIAKGGVTLEDIVQLQDLTFDYELSAADMGLPTGSVPFVPPLNIDSVGTYDFDLPVQFARIEVDEMELTLQVNNPYPVNVKQGTVIELRYKSNQDVIHTFTLTQDIDPYGNYQEAVLVNNKVLEEELEVNVRDFNTDGSPDPTFIDPNVAYEVSMNFDFLDIASLDFFPSQVFNAADTTQFNLEGADIDVYAIEGVFNTYIDNGFPVSAEVQLYFLPSNQDTIIDSLFLINPGVTIPSLNSDGTVSTSLESKFITPVTKEKITRLRRASYVVVTLQLESPSFGTNLRALDSDQIGAQIVGDLKVQVNE